MKIFMIVSGGGHLDEAISLVSAFQGHELILISYRLKSLSDFTHPQVKKKYFLSLFASHGPVLWFSLIIDLFEFFGILVKERPQILFSTGSEIAYGPFILGKLFLRTKNIFLETVTRPDTPSETAKHVYPFTDLFLVQSERLLPAFGKKAVYAGAVL
jgi:beta-1,4-N-acetylglucosaminyltransferase